jgi:hypothetical protein
MDRARKCSNPKLGRIVQRKTAQSSPPRANAGGLFFAMGKLGTQIGTQRLNTGWYRAGKEGSGTSENGNETGRLETDRNKAVQPIQH